jgi:hypothetical protein
MKEWRIRQEIYHRLNKDYDDDLNKVQIKISDDIVQDAIRHFNERVDEWIYPSKSYFVAICYAEWLSEDFGEDFYDLLNDDMLLAGNDPYFQTFLEDPDTYNQIIDAIDYPIKMKGMVPDVRKYYESEFSIGL